MVPLISESAALAGLKAFLTKMAEVLDDECVLFQTDTANLRRIAVQAGLLQIAPTPGRHGQQHNRTNDHGECSRLRNLTV